MFLFKTSATANYEKKIYDFSIESINGETIDFKDYKNKVILVVNTASYCGFTKQYSDMQILWDTYKKDGLVVIGVPSNSFNQEKDEDSEVNFISTFLLYELFKRYLKSYKNRHCTDYKDLLRLPTAGQLKKMDEHTADMWEQLKEGYAHLKKKHIEKYI